MSALCGFYVDNGKHCVIDDVCIVCKAADMPLAPGDVIKLEGFDSIDGVYRVAKNRKGTLALEYLHV